MMIYRKLKPEEKDLLKQQGCTAESWDSVRVSEKFTPERIHHVDFMGSVSLGVFTEETDVPERGVQATGIYHSTLKNCTIGDNAYLNNVQNLYQYEISHHAILDTIQSLSVTGKTAFGNGTEIEVLNEGGGRELPIFDQLSAQIAYCLVHFRHNKALTEKILALVNDHCESKTSTTGCVGPYAKVRHCHILRNVHIGEYADICGAQLLQEGTLAGSQNDPVKIGPGVIAQNFIVQSGSHINDGVLLDKCFVGQGVRLGKQYSAEGSAFFANCEGFHGEAVSVFGGPYTVTHHKSTLMIAGMFSFYNAGSGTNQSNHMYKLGPLHQGILERGAKTGSLSYMLWPCGVGPFSVVTGKHAGNFDATDFPFSYITVEGGKSQLTPAMNLFTVGTRRDSEKWPARDRRKDSRKYDQIHFDLFNPRTIGKVLQAIQILKDLNEKSRKEQEFVNYKGLVIKRLLLRTGTKYYKIAVAVYLGDVLMQFSEKAGSPDELKKQLQNIQVKTVSLPEKWYDMAGMLISQSRLDACLEKLQQDETNSVEKLLSVFETAAEKYGDDNLKWWAQLIHDRFGVSPENLSKEQLAEIIEGWKSNALKLNNMILKDAEKEFDPTSRIGYGLDGDAGVQNADFEAVRGTYDDNKFVKNLKKENEEIVTRAEKALKIL